MRAREVAVKREPDDPPDVVIAKHIVEIATAMRKLMGGPLKERAIVLLIHDAMGSTKVAKRDIAKILATIENLAHTFVKKGLKP